MSIEHNHVTVRVDARRLAENFKQIRNRAAYPAPVLKADAYGHGCLTVARICQAAGAETLTAGSVAECAAIQDVVPEMEIISLLGPVDSADYRLACERQIVVCTGHWEQLGRLDEEGRKSGRPALVAVKFDTGMSRLGFAVEDAARVAEMLMRLPHVRPVLLCSHLATADDPAQAEYVREQGQRFATVVRALRERGLSLRTSLVNSGGIFGHPDLHHDLQRPGLALYGRNPFYGTAWQDRTPELRQAMSVFGRIVQIQDIPAGRSVSYQRMFTSDRPMRIAIVTMGYAGNYALSLSGKAQMLIHGCRVPVLGRVCMQLTVVDVSQIPEAAPGDAAFVLGGDGPDWIRVEELAEWWGTIPYEVFCVLGQNHKEYVHLDEALNNPADPAQPA